MSKNHNSEYASLMFDVSKSLASVGLAALAGLLCIASAASALGGEGAVYVQTNTAPTNYVVVFDRSHDGTLTLVGRVPTGGVGKPAGNPPLGIPYLDTAGSVTLSDNGKVLFVVNAGDNTVSSFRVRSHGLEFADREATFGSRPVSSTSHDHLLYVLNSETTSASISGYRVNDSGIMRPIPGSVRPTINPTGGIPAQIQFDANGTFLAVSERQTFVGHGVIDIFPVDSRGVAGSPVAHPSSDDGPFGISFTHNDLMIVSNEHFALPPPTSPSTVSSYDLDHDGTVTPIDTESAHAAGACWNAITNDEKFVFITSPFTANINSFRIGRHGDLIPVNETSVVATAAGVTLDISLSRDSKFLYVLVSAGPFASSTIYAYALNKDGTITLIGATAPFEGSASGTAAK